MPNTDNILKWVHDLETTDEPQTQGKLFDGTGYCCLGRLCKVAGLEFKQDSEGDWYVDGEEGECELLAPEYVVVSFLGLDAYIFDQNRYATMNDTDRLSFKEIAANIRCDLGLEVQTDA